MSRPNEQIPSGMKRVGIGAAAMALGILVVGAYTRFSDARDLKSWTHEADIPSVSLVKPQSGGKNQSLALPGTLQAWYDAKIYAQVPGYVHAWYKDIGAHVKKGERLAAIDTPELDQQVAQAQADLSGAIAAQKLSAVTAKRWQDLARQNAVAQQDVDEKEADLAAKNDAVNSDRANLARLSASKAFARIVAPFDGIVTQRNVDIGALVSDSSTGSPLFAVSDTHALRLYVNVPQSWSSRIVAGMNVVLTVPEYPGRTFAATLVATSGAIDAQSSTLLAQFEAPNPDGLLKPGGFAEVSLSLPPGAAALRLPASTLMFRAEGLRVATLGQGDRIVMKAIVVGTDLGTQVLVTSGLKPDDRVVDNPPDSLAAGDPVRVTRDNDKPL